MTEAGAIVAVVIYAAVVGGPLVGSLVIDRTRTKRAQEERERGCFQNRLIGEAHAIAANAYRLVRYYKLNKAEMLRRRSER